MSEYTITKEAILKMAEACPTAKSVLKAGFPDAFKEERQDITQQLNMEWHDHNGRYDIHFRFQGESIGYLYPGTGEAVLETEYSYEKGSPTNNCITIFKNAE